MSAALLARYRLKGTNEVELLAALERARVVGVLDAWAAERGYEWSCQGRHTVMLRDQNNVPFLCTGATPDAARAAAAKAIEAGEV